MSAHLDQLACNFFKIFAQYEYALKAMQFAHQGHGGQAEPDWDRFSNEIGYLILENPNQDLKNAIDYLFKQPPKKQILIDGILSWENVPNHERSPQILFGHIRRVRNNLYHGGKFNGRWFEPDRSAELISKALLVLTSLQVKHDDLTAAIQGNHD